MRKFWFVPALLGIVLSGFPCASQTTTFIKRGHSIMAVQHSRSSLRPMDSPSDPSLDGTYNYPISMNERAFIGWFIDFDLGTCKSTGVGSLSASSGPAYGIFTWDVETILDDFEPQCAGHYFTAAVAYYTWTATSFATLTDSFQMTYTDPTSLSFHYDLSYTLAGKSNGDCCGRGDIGGSGAGDPVDVGTGNVFEQTLDYTTAGRTPLTFIRYYNSLSDTGTYALELGHNWRSNYDLYLDIQPNGAVNAERPDGQVLSFTASGNNYVTDSDVDVTLTKSGSTWTLTDHNDTVETYTTVSASEAVVNSIVKRNGYTQSLAYNGSGQLASVTDSYGRQLMFAYNGGALESVVAPDDLTVTYGYSTVSSPNDQLVSVSYSTSPTASIHYIYNDTNMPYCVTSVIDENGNTYGTWTYDNTGRGLTSQVGSGNNLTTIVYDDATGSRTVANAFGVDRLIHLHIVGRYAEGGADFAGRNGHDCGGHGDVLLRFKWVSRKQDRLERQSNYLRQ
jgi:YD repeat-containing protein